MCLFFFFSNFFFVWFLLKIITVGKDGATKNQKRGLENAKEEQEKTRSTEISNEIRVWVRKEKKLVKEEGFRLFVKEERERDSKAKKKELRERWRLLTSEVKKCFCEKAKKEKKEAKETELQRHKEEPSGVDVGQKEERQEAQPKEELVRETVTVIEEKQVEAKESHVPVRSSAFELLVKEEGQKGDEGDSLNGSCSDMSKEERERLLVPERVEVERKKEELASKSPLFFISRKVIEEQVRISQLFPEEGRVWEVYDELGVNVCINKLLGKKISKIKAEDNVCLGLDCEWFPLGRMETDTIQIASRDNVLVIQCINFRKQIAHHSLCSTKPFFFSFLIFFMFGFC